MDSCVTSNNYNNIHLPSSLNSRTVFHVVPQALCWTIAHLDIGRRLLGVHAQEVVQTVRPHNLNTQDFGWAGITVFLTTGGMLPLDQSDSDWIIHTDIQLFSYFHFFWVNLLFISNTCVFLSRFYQLQREFFVGWANQAQKFVHYPTRYYSTTRLWGH